MRTICIAGKNNIAVDVMLYCLEMHSDFRIICITNKNETGKNSWQKSLKWFANRYGVEIVKLEDVYRIEDLVFLSAEFDQIINPELFVSKELYNIHFSLLPKYKGVYTSVLPILFGESKTGVTFHRIRSGIDTGEIIDQEIIPINNKDSSLDLYKKLISIGTEVIIRNLVNVINCRIHCRQQEKDGSTYYSKNSIDFSNIELNTKCTAFQIQNQVRAFCFRPFQLIKWNDQKYIRCDITDNVSSRKPGTLLNDNDICTEISTIDYDVILYKDLFEDLLDSIITNNNNKAKKECSCVEIVNSQNENGWSPLVVATYNNNTEMVEYLINHGADINVKNINGTTLLMYAKDAGLRTGDWTIFRLLYERGLDPKEKDYNQNSIKDYLVDYEWNIVPVDIKRLIE